MIDLYGKNGPAVADHWLGDLGLTPRLQKVSADLPFSRSLPEQV